MTFHAHPTPGGRASKLEDDLSPVELDSFDPLLATMESTPASEALPAALAEYQRRFEERGLSKFFVAVAEMNPPRIAAIARGEGGFILRAGGRAFIVFGRGGSTKTLLVQLLAICLSLGIPCPPFFNVQGEAPIDVLYLDCEEGARTAWTRFNAIARGLDRDPSELSHIAYRRLPGVLDDEAKRDLLAFVAVTRPGLLIIDTFTAAMPGRDQKDPDDVARRLAFLTELPEELIPVFLIVDHEALGTNDKAPTPYGGGSKENKAQATVRVTRNADVVTVKAWKANAFDAPSVSDSSYTLTVETTDEGDEPHVIRFDPVAGGIAKRSAARARMKPGSTGDAILKILYRSRRPLAARDIDDELNAGESPDSITKPETIKRARMRLRDEGLIRLTDAGMWEACGVDTDQGDTVTHG